MYNIEMINFFLKLYSYIIYDQWAAPDSKKIPNLGWQYFPKRNEIIQQYTL